MKHWGLRILSALLTFTLGTGATIIGWRYFKPILIQPVRVAPKIDFQLPSPQIAENTEPTVKADEIMKPHPVSISPYEIKRIIDGNNKADLQGQRYNLEPIWKQIGIEKSEDDLNQCNYSICPADIFMLELDGKPGKETILRIGTEVTNFYLIFKPISVRRSTGESWKMLGYIEAFTRWSDEKYRVESIGTQHWLVVEETTGHGSGFGSYADTWYEVSEKGVMPVLSYQTSLFAATWGVEPGIDRKTKISKIDYRDGITTVTVRLSTSYNGYREPQHLSPQQTNERLHLWTDKREATFIKGPGMQKFVFDPLHSELTEKELDPNYGDGESLNDEEFLKYNYRALLKIANERWTKRKEWLFDFLKSCGDSLEKQSLFETAVINDKCPY